MIYKLYRMIATQNMFLNYMFYGANTRLSRNHVDLPYRY